MNTIFDEGKTTQVAVNLIKLSGGKIQYLKLIQLMYLAEKEALLKWGRPITYDSYFLTQYGPILGNTFNLIKGLRQGQIWFKYISPLDNFEVSLHQDCSFDNLSEAEENLVDEIFQQYGYMETWELSGIFCKSLGKWQDLKNRSIKITYRDILQIGGKSKEEIDSIQEELDNVYLMAQVLGCQGQSTLIHHLNQD